MILIFVVSRGTVIIGPKVVSPLVSPLSPPVVSYLDRPASLDCLGLAL
jgi:hypothetical protein